MKQHYVKGKVFSDLTGNLYRSWQNQIIVFSPCFWQGKLYQMLNKSYPTYKKFFISSKWSIFNKWRLSFSYVCTKSLQSCPTLCNSMGCSPPGSSAHGILQARILARVTISFSRGFPDPGIKTESLMSPALASGFFITSTTWEALSF